MGKKVSGHLRRHAHAITLRETSHFHARGMKRVHTWRLTRMDEFHRILAYHGQIWASKDNRLLVRFRTKYIMWRSYHVLLSFEICGMTAADLFRLKFDSGSAEAAALRGNVITVRDNGRHLVVSGGTLTTLDVEDLSNGPGGRMIGGEDGFWLS